MCQQFFLGTLEIPTYELFNALAVLLAIIVNLSLHKRKLPLLSFCSKVYINQSKFSPRLCIFFETVIITVMMYSLGGICSTILSAHMEHYRANYYGVVMLSPFAVAALLWLVRINPLKQIDLFTPSYAIMLTGFKVACFMHGCCWGLPSPAGLYFPCRQRCELPSQLYEAAAAFIIFLILLLLLIKNRPRTPGTLFPIYAILYSTTRFLTEFTRDDPVGLLGLREFQWFGILGTLVGVAELLLMLKYGQKISNYFDKKIAGSCHGVKGKSSGGKVK